MSRKPEKTMLKYESVYGEHIELEAELTDVPGLIMHKPLGRSRTWVVSHQPSGCKIATFGTKKAAREFAVKAGELADWTTSEKEIKAIAGIADAVARLKKECAKPRNKGEAAQPIEQGGSQ